MDWLNLMAPRRLAFPNANSGIAGSSQRVLNHDMLGRLSAIAHWDSEGEHRSHHGYSYNQAGLRSAETLGASSPSTRSFTYDDYRQLSTAVNPGDARYDFIFSHDATGNRLTAQWHHGAGAWDQWSFTPNALNQFASARFNAAPAAGPRYDANGNLTDRLGDGFVDYVWDEENRLIAIHYGSGNYTLIDYDGLSRRVRRVEYRNHAATETIHYVYDGLIPVQELDENFAVVRQLTRGLDLAGTLGGAGGTGDLLAVSLPNGGQADGWESHYYLYDGNGNVTGLVAGEDISSRGIVQDQMVAEYVYSPFGRLLNDPSANLLDQPWQFSSQEAHAASGLHLYLYRAYDVEWGRWLSRDPIGETGGVNLYGFVGNRPISYYDYLGAAWYNPFSYDASDRAAFREGWAEGANNIIRTIEKLLGLAEAVQETPPEATRKPPCPGAQGGMLAGLDKPRYASDQAIAAALANGNETRTHGNLTMVVMDKKIVGNESVYTVAWIVKSKTAGSIVQRIRTETEGYRSYKAGNFYEAWRFDPSKSSLEGRYPDGNVDVFFMSIENMTGAGGVTTTGDAMFVSGFDPSSSPDWAMRADTNAGGLYSAFSAPPGYSTGGIVHSLSLEWGPHEVMPGMVNPDDIRFKANPIYVP